jgi:hypothetical protein
MGFRRGSFVAFGLVWALSFISFFEAGAQKSREEFGKNRIQYRQFDWQYLSGENFDVYYYDARKGVAQEALELTRLITHPTSRPKYFSITRLPIYVKAM